MVTQSARFIRGATLCAAQRCCFAFVVGAIAFAGVGCIQRDRATCVASTCDSCIRATGCGWCASSNQCVSGTSLGADGICPAYLFLSCSGNFVTPTPTPITDSGPVFLADTRVLPVGDPSCPVSVPRTFSLGPNSISVSGASLVRGTCARSGPEVVGVFVPAITRNYTLETSSSSVDAVVYVREQVGAACSDIGCDDDNGPGSEALLSVSLNANRRYLIFADSFGAGTYTLTIR